MNQPIVTPLAQPVCIRFNQPKTQRLKFRARNLNIFHNFRHLFGSFLIRFRILTKSAISEEKPQIFVLATKYPQLLQLKSPERSVAMAYNNPSLACNQILALIPFCEGWKFSSIFIALPRDACNQSDLHRFSRARP